MLKVRFDGLTFETFMQAVDTQLIVECGLTSSDLEDWNYRDAFNDESSPIETALDVLDYVGFDSFMDGECCPYPPNYCGTVTRFPCVGECGTLQELPMQGKMR